ncbi:MAG: hypothetical protein QOI21_29 [Actinomycetota bacterium]|jgi:hypothetical protein|nr:hypothetical protein [Actinomycetota bacterium]
MSTNQVDRVLEELNKTMKLLRDTMKTPVIRTAGFKKDHTQVGKSIAAAVTTVEAGKPLFETDARAPRARRRR